MANKPTTTTTAAGIEIPKISARPASAELLRDVYEELAENPRTRLSAERRDRITAGATDLTTIAAVKGFGKDDKGETIYSVVIPKVIADKLPEHAAIMHVNARGEITVRILSAEPDDRGESPSVLDLIPNVPGSDDKLAAIECVRFDSVSVRVYRHKIERITYSAVGSSTGSSAAAEIEDGGKPVKALAVAAPW